MNDGLLENVEVRIATPSDRDGTLDVQRRAFGHARGGDPADDIAGIVASVGDDEGSFGVVATRDGAVIGHVQFSRAWIGETPVLILGPVGVLPDAQGRGIGSSVIKSGLGEAQRRGERAVVLLGDPAFYTRFGFIPGARLGLRNPAAGTRSDGFVIREEDFQVLVLDERAPLTGRVRWHPAFD